MWGKFPVVDPSSGRWKVGGPEEEGEQEGEEIQPMNQVPEDMGGCSLPEHQKSLIKLQKNPVDYQVRKNPVQVRQITQGP